MSVTVQRQNVVLDVEEDNVDKYLSNGFSVIDEFGNVVRGSAPTTLQDYKILVDKLSRELEIAKQENAKLKAEKEKRNEVIKDVKPKEVKQEEVITKSTKRRTKNTAKAE